MRTIAATAIAAVITFGSMSVAESTNNHSDDPRIPNRPCVYEDGSHKRDANGCFWDAGVRGNRKGNSYWIDRKGDYHYLDVRVQRRMDAKYGS